MRSQTEELLSALRRRSSEEELERPHFARRYSFEDLQPAVDPAALNTPKAPGGARVLRRALPPQLKVQHSPVLVFLSPESPSSESAPAPAMNARMMGYGKPKGAGNSGKSPGKRGENSTPLSPS